MFDFALARSLSHSFGRSFVCSFQSNEHFQFELYLSCNCIHRVWLIFNLILLSTPFAIALSIDSLSHALWDCNCVLSVQTKNECQPNRYRTCARQNITAMLNVWYNVFVCVDESFDTFPLFCFLLQFQYVFFSEFYCPSNAHVPFATCVSISKENFTSVYCTCCRCLFFLWTFARFQWTSIHFDASNDFRQIPSYDIYVCRMAKAYTFYRMQ